MKVHRLNPSKFPDIALKSRQAHYPYCPIMLYLLKTLASLATNHIRPFRKTLLSKWLFPFSVGIFGLIFILSGFRAVFIDRKKALLGPFSLLGKIAGSQLLFGTPYFFLLFKIHGLACQGHKFFQTHILWISIL